MRIFGSLNVILEEKLAFKNKKILGSKSTNELVPYLEHSASHKKYSIHQGQLTVLCHFIRTECFCVAPSETILLYMLMRQIIIVK